MVVNDPDFGPGDAVTELLSGRCVLLAPVDAANDKAATSSLPPSRLLAGFRGQPRLALDALADAAARLPMLATDGSYAIRELDIEPLAVAETAAIAVNVLIRAQSGQNPEHERGTKEERVAE